ncbi:hypothetical protein BDR26DRAFT_849574 [Obelidium mucronatum]|nr:hypothetical protein BDR26DRAFT_849574 [Obelidium mucronatum]
MGILAGGLENGEMALWDPRIIIENAKNKTANDPFIMKPVKHKGPVRGLDFNPVDSKFLASGAADGELFIWDLTNPAKPYSPGARSSRLDDVTAVAWNRMFYYILASASNNGNTVIWDLRHKKEIAAFSHPGGRRQISSIAWNPDSPTQIATASDDDATPVILMWDLRNSRAPEKVLTGHSKGVLNLAWCPKDSDLLLSCGKDNRTIVWNPSGAGTIIGDLHHSSNWSFEAQWCNRNPDLIAVAGFDGKLSVHSLQGGGKGVDDSVNEAAAAASHQISPDDFFNQSFPSIQHQPSHISNSQFRLPHPPKWLRRPVGASWGFGNRLVRFGSSKQSDGSSRQTVSIRNVVSEPAFVSRAAELERINAGGTVEAFIDYCTKMSHPESTAAISEKDRDLWRFLGVMFETGSREQVLQFLGFDKAEVASTDKLAALLKKLLVSTEPEIPVVEETGTANANDGANHDLNNGGFDGFEADDDFALIAAQNKRAPTPAAAPALPPALPFKLYSSVPGESADTDALITKALVLRDFKSAVRICFGANRLADALAFAISGGPELLAFAQQEYFKRVRNEKSYIRVLESVVKGDLDDIVQNAQIDGTGEADWKDLLALICMYGLDENLPALFGTLGRRLEAIATAPMSASSLKTTDWKGREEKKFAAVLCYLVAGDLSKVLAIWALREVEEEKLIKTSKDAKSLLTTPKSSHNLALQSLIEKVQVFRQAIEFVDVELMNGVQDPNATKYTLDSLYQRYLEYAQVAASQGLLTVAWKALELVPQAYEAPKVDPLASDILKDRLYKSGLVRNAVASYEPRFPFEFVDLTKPVVAPVVNSYNPNSFQNNQSYGTYQQNSYNQSNSQGYGNNYPAATPSYNNQYQPANSGYVGYSPQPQFHQPSVQPRQAFAPPPPPAVNTGLGNQFTNSYQAAPVPPPTAAAQGGYNPYGQHQNQYTAAPPPAAGGFVPPPPVAVKSVSHSAQYSAQPQTMQPNSTWAGTTPPSNTSGQPQPEKFPPPAAAGPKRHPSGDRTHIKPTHLPIVTGLDAVMNVCKESKTQPQQKREWEDTEKKVAEDILAKLAVLVKALQGGDYSAAHKIQVELMTTKFSATSSWIVGVKRVIDTLERAELDKQQAQRPAVPQNLPPQQSQQQYGTRPPPPAAGGSYVSAAPPPANQYGTPCRRRSGHQYGNAPPPAASQYGAAPPPAANPYGSSAPPPPAANQYTSAAPPPAANHYGNAPPPATNQYAAGVPPPTAAQQYNRPGTLPPPPPASAASNAYSAPPPSAGATSPYGGAPPPAARTAFSPAAPAPAQPYGGQQQGLPPPPPASGNQYGANTYGAQGQLPPPTAGSNPYGGAQLPPPPPAATNPYGGGGNQPGYGGY